MIGDQSYEISNLEEEITKYNNSDSFDFEDLPKSIKGSFVSTFYQLYEKMDWMKSNVGTYLIDAGRTAGELFTQIGSTTLKEYLESKDKLKGVSEEGKEFLKKTTLFDIYDTCEAEREKEENHLRENLDSEERYKVENLLEGYPFKLSEEGYILHEGKEEKYITDKLDLIEDIESEEEDYQLLNRAFQRVDTKVKDEIENKYFTSTKEIVNEVIDEVGGDNVEKEEEVIRSIKDGNNLRTLLKEKSEPLDDGFTNGNGNHQKREVNREGFTNGQSEKGGFTNGKQGKINGNGKINGTSSGFINGMKGNRESGGKKTPSKLKLGAIAATAIMGIAGAAYAFSKTPDEPDYEDKYQELFGLEDTQENQSFVQDFIDIYPAEDEAHFNAMQHVIEDGNVSGDEVVDMIKTNRLSSKEFGTLPSLLNHNQSLRNHGNLSLVLSEMDELNNDYMERSDKRLVNEIVSSYNTLNSSERSSITLNPLNKSGPQGSNQNQKEDKLKEEVEREVRRHPYAMMDQGDLAHWLWTNFSEEHDIDTQSNESKVLWSILSEYRSLLKKDEFSGRKVIETITGKAENVGIDNLKQASEESFSEVSNLINPSIFQRTRSTYNLTGKSKPLSQELSEDSLEEKLQSDGGPWNDWNLSYFKGVFGELNETDNETDHLNRTWNGTLENRKFNNLTVSKFNLSNPKDYHALRNVSLSINNGMWLARYIAANQLDKNETKTIAKLQAANQNLTDLGNLTIYLSEVDELQDGINNSEKWILQNITNAYENLSPIEKRNLFLRPQNHSESTTITGYEITKHGMDGGDLLWEMWNISDQKGLELSNVTQGKVPFAYASVFDGLLNGNKSFKDWNNSEVIDYISKQWNEFGTQNLSEIANFNDSLLWLQQKVWPGTIFTDNPGDEPFYTGTFWTDHYWNGSVRNAYAEAREFWRNHSLDSEVVEESGDIALENLYSWVETNLVDFNATVKDPTNFTDFYENFFWPFQNNQTVGMECSGISTTATFLLRSQNHLYIENDKVTNETPSDKIPFTGPQILVPDVHSSLAYIGKNLSNNNPEVVLEPFVYKKVDANDELNLQIPPAFWYEVEGIEGIGWHNTYGQRNVDVMKSEEETLSGKPYYNLTELKPSQIHNRTKYFPILNYSWEAQSGAVEVSHGYLEHSPFNKTIYDLLYKDQATPIPEYPPLLGALAAGGISLGALAYNKRKKKWDNEEVIDYIAEKVKEKEE